MEVAPNEIFAVVNRVGKVSVFAAPAPICKVAPFATFKVPVPLPVIWKPPSAKIPEVTERLLFTVVAAPRVADVPALDVKL